MENRLIKLLKELIPTLKDQEIVELSENGGMLKRGYIDSLNLIEIISKIEEEFNTIKSIVRIIIKRSSH
jgi:acyl carrier protein